MTRKILCVDDEENVLRAFERNLRLHFEIETAAGPGAGLRAVQERGPYAVVVSDLRMPEMDGIQFLAAVRKLAPDCVRLILSGNADLESAIAAVNEGNVFQFLTKPCPADTLRGAIDGALKQHRLVVAERELLEETLNGVIGMLAEALAPVSPFVFSRSLHVRRYVRHMATHLRFPNLWELDAAATLSLIGCAAVPAEILKNVYAGNAVTADEQKIFDSHPLVAYRCLAEIPRMEAIAEIVRWQTTPFRELRSMNLPEIAATGAQMLMIAHQFDSLVSRGASAHSALSEMSERPEIWQSKLVTAMHSLPSSGTDIEMHSARPRDVRTGARPAVPETAAAAGSRFVAP